MKYTTFVALALCVGVFAWEGLSLGSEKSYETVALTYDEALRQAPQCAIAGYIFGRRTSPRTRSEHGQGEE